MNSYTCFRFGDTTSTNTGRSLRLPRSILSFPKLKIPLQVAGGFTLLVLCSGMKITIPIPEKLSTNKIYSGIHWTKRNQHKNLYRNYFLDIKPNQNYEFPVEITYIFRFKSKWLDNTNATYMAKLIEDSLIKQGFIPDDSPDYVNGTHIFCYKGNRDEVDIHIL